MDDTIDLSALVSESGQRESGPRKRAKRRTEPPPVIDSSPEAEKPSIEISPELVTVLLGAAIAKLYSMLGRIESWIVVRATGLSWDQVSPIILYTDEEISELVPPTCKVIAKYAGSLTQYAELLELGLTLAKVHAAKIQAIVELKESRKPVEVPKKEAA